MGVSSILLLVGFLALMYFLMIRPQKKKEKEDQAMRDALQVGDEIMTIGGVIGKVVKISEKSVVISTGADKNKIEFIKSAIANVNKTPDSKPAPKSKKADAEAEDKTVVKNDKKVTPKKLSKKADEEAEKVEEKPAEKAEEK